VKRILLSGAFFLFTALPFAASQNSIKGDWVGIVQWTEKASPIRLHFSEDGSGTLNLPFEEIVDQPLTQLKLTEGKIHFEFIGSINNFRFQLTQTAETQKHRDYIS
jgi:hypothetical protein